MKQTTEMGTNRTGMGMAPQLGPEMIEGAQQRGATHAAEPGGLHRIHRSYLDDASPVGSVPPPSSMKGAASAGIQALKGNKPSVLLNKLGERLAFERSGTRLYEAMLDKFDAEGSWSGGPTREELQHFRDEELKHFHMVKEAIESLGADPTAMTPAADVAGVASEGVMKVVTDPRISLAESLEGILTAELVDHDGWEMLIKLTEGMGQKKLAKGFREALAEEDVHLASVRKWLTAHSEAEAKRELQQ